MNFLSLLEAKRAGARLWPGPIRELVREFTAGHNGVARSRVTYHGRPAVGWRWEARLARKLRVESPGAVCHVMKRGNRQEAIYKVEAFKSGDQRAQFEI
jgi:hypothetical protein